MNPHRLCLVVVVMVAFRCSTGLAAPPRSPLAAEVTIHRDAWGVPHIFGKTDAATLFGMGYAQAEDYFWQLEDNFIRGLGRYAEVYGEDELRNDVLNHAFEVVARSKADFAATDAATRRLFTAFTDGINDYLATHPEVKPRLLDRFEPWFMLALDRHMFLDFAYGRTHAGRPQPDRLRVADAAAADLGHSRTRPGWQILAQPLDPFELDIRAAIGSNQWAIGPAKTRNQSAMLFVNPHQPWFGWGQYYEAHVHSEESLRFSGAGFFGSPVPSKGHNEHLGWTYTTNDPDIADAWRVTFDHPQDPLKYRYADGYRDATEWTDTIAVRKGDQLKSQTFRFRKTHHGPVVRQLDETTYLSARIARLFDVHRGTQALEMIRATRFDEWYLAASRCAIPLFNIAYADRAGNIFYVYNAAIPVRDPQFNWTRPVDGSDPRTEWQGFHAFDELPQLLNPSSSYVQNCNSTPFTTTDDENPFRGDFPAYMLEDRDDDKRRAKVSRMLLREASDLTLDRLEALAYDTTLYWPLVEIPKFERDLVRLREVDAERADRVRPYLEHLADWDCVAREDSTQTTLCVAWYEALYGTRYPAEQIKEAYRADRLKRLDALAEAAAALQRLHGDWKVPWGNVHRIQRVVDKATVLQAALFFNRLGKSVPCRGVPGPLGVVFTVYSTPSVPFVRPERYAVVGTSYMAVIEFGEQIETRSIMPFGANSDPTSANYFDQAELFSQRRLKPAWFYPADVHEHAVKSYRPGE